MSTGQLPSSPGAPQQLSWANTPQQFLREECSPHSADYQDSKEEQQIWTTEGGDRVTGNVTDFTH